MSREERRAYQRMMKGSDREPRLPPAAQARRERARARREARAASGASSRRFWFWTILLAAFAALIAFSMQWPAMPNALYIGLLAGGAVLLVLAGLRFLVRRGARR